MNLKTAVYVMFTCDMDIREIFFFHFEIPKKKDNILSSFGWHFSVHTVKLPQNWPSEIGPTHF